MKDFKRFLIILSAFVYFVNAQHFNVGAGEDLKKTKNGMYVETLNIKDFTDYEDDEIEETSTSKHTTAKHKTTTTPMTTSLEFTTNESNNQEKILITTKKIRIPKSTIASSIINLTAATNTHASEILKTITEQSKDTSLISTENYETQDKTTENSTLSTTIVKPNILITEIFAFIIYFFFNF
ncbi:hypothetical protein PVAND_002158 [Polypedilum vanderplanki]|uniref:Uncharacterized protein n=1 Tax=Polypedilum vanderplanki TaxID=319348 RepID=A0A9J6BQH3_POLVA|nr:hypothetical protein PVAND_002158 [Polypedilum vanderplanki]